MKLQMYSEFVPSGGSVTMIGDKPEEQRRLTLLAWLLSGLYNPPLDEFQKYPTYLANSKGQKLLPSEFARSKADLNY